MEDENTLLPETLDALAKAFAPDTALVPAAQVTMEDVQRFLIEKITELLDRNPGWLMHLLYRIDVAEPAVKRVLSESNPADIPADLADLIIERQLQKIRIRRRYQRR